MIARLFLTQWRKVLPAPVSKLIFGLLCALWVAVAIGMLLHFAPVTWALRRSPVGVRSAFSAFGNTWGLATLVSLALYYVWQFFARNPPRSHSPGRRRL